MVEKSTIAFTDRTNSTRGVERDPERDANHGWSRPQVYRKPILCSAFTWAFCYLKLQRYFDTETF